MDDQTYISIIRHTAGNLYWKDRNGKYLGCNNEFARLIGLKSPDEIVGKDDRELFIDSLGKEGVEATIALDQSVILTGAEKIVEEVGLDKAKNLAFYLTKKVPLRDEENNIIGVIGTSIDITKQKQAEIAKTEFIHNMSHDLRTPFSGILGFSRILYQEEVDSKKKQFLGFIVDSSEELLKLINELLEIAKLGTYAVKYEALDIRDLVESVIKFFRADIEFKHLAVINNCPKVTVMLDKFRFGRILLNIIGNAVKFTPKGYIEINASISNTIDINIKDTGIGIPKNKLEYIFEEFNKIKPSYVDGGFYSLGLGLYIVKRFIQDLNGTVHVESEENKGSTFRVSLPIPNLD